MRAPAMRVKTYHVSNWPSKLRNPVSLNSGKYGLEESWEHQCHADVSLPSMQDPSFSSSSALKIENKKGDS